MKFENTLTGNWENAFRGLRNPMDSWDKSDSYGGLYQIYGDEGVEAVSRWIHYVYPDIEEGSEEWNDAENEYYNFLDTQSLIRIDDHDDIAELFFIGPNDMNLAQRMITAGPPNDKFLRQIFVSVDITGPLYWWKEMDQYKIGTVTNSTSTMHKLASNPITLDCFETDDMDKELLLWPGTDTGLSEFSIDDLYNDIICHCERLRKLYNETKNIQYWKELVRILPESWLQKRTWTANYAVLRNIWHWRRDHKLTEWHSFCNWIKDLPYSEDLIQYKN